MIQFPFTVSDPDLYSPDRGDTFDPERAGWYRQSRITESSPSQDPEETPQK